jgi:hypothetical protein
LPWFGCSLWYLIQIVIHTFKIACYEIKSRGNIPQK